VPKVIMKRILDENMGLATSQPGIEVADSLSDLSHRDLDEREHQGSRAPTMELVVSRSLAGVDAPA
jgi:hypothetical protein